MLHFTPKQIQQGRLLRETPYENLAAATLDSGERVLLQSFPRLQADQDSPAVLVQPILQLLDHDDPRAALGLFRTPGKVALVWPDIELSGLYADSLPRTAGGIIQDLLALGAALEPLHKAGLGLLCLTIRQLARNRDRMVLPPLAFTNRLILQSAGPIPLGDPAFPRYFPDVQALPPELLSSGATDQRSDVFQFGVLAATLLTGRTCFEGGSTLEVMNQVRRGVVRAELSGHLVKALGTGTQDPIGTRAAVEALMAALRPSPEDRPSSVREVCRLLEALPLSRTEPQPPASSPRPYSTLLLGSAPEPGGAQLPAGEILASAMSLRESSRSRTRSRNRTRLFTLGLAVTLALGMGLLLTRGMGPRTTQSSRMKGATLSHPDTSGPPQLGREARSSLVERIPSGLAQAIERQGVSLSSGDWSLTRERGLCRVSIRNQSGTSLLVFTGCRKLDRFCTGADGECGADDQGTLWTRVLYSSDGIPLMLQQDRPSGEPRSLPIHEAEQ